MKRIPPKFWRHDALQDGVLARVLEFHRRTFGKDVWSQNQRPEATILVTTMIKFEVRPRLAEREVVDQTDAENSIVVPEQLDRIDLNINHSPPPPFACARPRPPCATTPPPRARCLSKLRRLHPDRLSFPTRSPAVSAPE